MGAYNKGARRASIFALEAIGAEHKVSVLVSYWGSLVLPVLVPLLLYATRRGKDEGDRLVRFHAMQAALLGPLLLVPYVVGVLLFFPLVGLSFLGALPLFVQGLMAIFGIGVRLPVVGGLAEKWSGHHPAPELSPSKALGIVAARMGIILLLIAGVILVQPVAALLVEIVRFGDLGPFSLTLVLIGGLVIFILGTCLSHRIEAARLRALAVPPKVPEGLTVVCVLLGLLSLIGAGLSVIQFVGAETAGAVGEAVLPQGLSLLVTIAFFVSAVELSRGKAWALWFTLIGWGVLVSSSIMFVAGAHPDLPTSVVENYGRLLVIAYLLLVYYLTKPSVRSHIRSGQKETS